MTFFWIGYGLLFISTAILVIWCIKTGLWHRQFLFFVHLLSFFVLNVAGMYSLVYSVYLPVPEVVNPERTLIGFFIVFISFIFSLPLYLYSKSANRKNVSFICEGIANEQSIQPIITVFLLWFVSLAIIVLHAFLRGAEYPLIILLKNPASMNAAKIVELRSSLGFIEFHWFQIGFYYLPIFLTAYTYLLMRYRQTNLFTSLFVGTFSVSVVLSLLFLFKGWVFILVAVLATAKVLADRRISGRAVAVMAVGIVIVMIMYKIYYSYFGLFDTAKILIHRILEAYPLNSGVAFGLFPTHRPFLNGLSINNPGGIFPYEHVNLSRIVFAYLYGGKGGAPVPSPVEGYVNFGYMGVALFALFGQLCVWVFSQLIEHLSHGVFALAMYAFAALWIAHLSMTSIFYSVLDLSIIATFLIIFIIQLFIAPIISLAGMRWQPIKEIVSR